jgi:hypothetical protein
MIGNQEFKANLSWQLIRHYGPGIKEDTVVPLERARMFIEKNYLDEKSNLKILLKDILTARGAEVNNPLVRFYSMEDTNVTLATRMSERMLGVPMGCAQCHDHKLYPELTQKEFWGLSAFFTDTKVEYVGTQQEAKLFFSKVRKGGKKLTKEEEILFNTWMLNEQQGKSLFEEKKTAYYKTLPSASYYNKEEDEYMMEDTSDPLKAPQIVVFEEKKSAGQIKVYYDREERKLNTRAHLPMKTSYSKSRGFPRENVAIWMSSPGTAKYLNRVTANWVLNWLMGQSVKQPIVDIYVLDDDQNKILDNFSSLLRKSGFNIPRFVRNVVLSKDYMQPITAEKSGIYTSRPYRYLAGRHLVNSLFYKRWQGIQTMGESSKKFTEQAELELIKFRYMKNYFSNSLETGLYDSGSTKQALFTATNEVWLKFTEKFARDGYTSKMKIADWVDDLYISLYSRRAIAKEKDYLTKLLNRKASFESSNFKDVVWALVNSPEMRFY